jgi:hypothetical protein
MIIDPGVEYINSSPVAYLELKLSHYQVERVQGQGQSAHLEFQ